jgi:hypothetical protein
MQIIHYACFEGGNHEEEVRERGRRRKIIKRVGGRDD